MLRLKSLFRKSVVVCSLIALVGSITLVGLPVNAATTDSGGTTYVTDLSTTGNTVNVNTTQVNVSPSSSSNSSGQAAGGVAGFSACAAKYLLGLTSFATSDTIQGLKAVPVSPQTTASTAATSGKSYSGFWSDCVEHGLAIYIGRMLLASMTQDIVGWINGTKGGFGNNLPAFVTDPEGFFKTIADQTAGDFIQGTALSFLCSPFKVQVQVALALNYAQNNNATQNTCTLSGIFNNVNNAFNSFSSGGWTGWLAISQNPQNNPYGAFLTANAQLQQQITSKIGSNQGSQVQQLSWGNGFMSFASCDDGTVIVGGHSVKDGSPASAHPNCKIKTPGTTIVSQLNSQLAEPAQQLGVASDLDEIFNALASKLFDTIFQNGTNGLLGSTQPDKTGKSSLDNLGNGLTSDQANALAQSNDYLNSQSGLYDNPTLPTNGSSGGNVNVAVGGHGFSSGGMKDNGCSNPQNAINGNSSAGANESPQNGCAGLTIVGPGPSGYSSWYEDLGQSQNIGSIIVLPRTDSGQHTPDATQFQVFVSTSAPDGNFSPSDLPGGIVYTSPAETMGHINPVVINLDSPVQGQYVSVLDTTNGQWLELAQVEIMTASSDDSGTIGITYPNDPGDGSGDGSGSSGGDTDSNGVYTPTFTTANTLSLSSNSPTTMTFQSNTTYQGGSFSGNGQTTMNLNSASNVIFSGVTFNGVTVRGDSSNNILFIHCVFENASGGVNTSGVNINNWNGGGIVYSTFQNIGGVASYDYTPSNISISHDLFTNVGHGPHIVWYPGGRESDELQRQSAGVTNNVEISYNVCTNVGNGQNSYCLELQGSPVNLDISHNWVGDYNQGTIGQVPFSIATGYDHTGGAPYPPHGAMGVKIHDNFFDTPPFAGNKQVVVMEVMGYDTQVYNNLAFGTWSEFTETGLSTPNWSAHDNTIAGSLVSAYLPAGFLTYESGGVPPASGNAYNNNVVAAGSISKPAEPCAGATCVQ